MPDQIAIPSCEGARKGPFRYAPEHCCTICAPLSQDEGKLVNIQNFGERDGLMWLPPYLGSDNFPVAAAWGNCISSISRLVAGIAPVSGDM
jgi:hypothetical protein